MEKVTNFNILYLDDENDKHLIRLQNKNDLNVIKDRFKILEINEFEEEIIRR